jgi:hypothetical protein
MASDTQETLYKLFAGLAGGPVSGALGSGGGLAGSAIGRGFRRRQASRRRTAAERRTSR